MLLDPMPARSMMVLVALVTPVRVPHQPQPPRTVAVTPAVRALAGCYALRADPWSPQPSNWPSPPALPARLHLDPVPTHGFTPGLRVSPDITTYHELPFAPSWRPDGPAALAISWFDGFTGPRLHLVRRGAEWQGVATFIYHEGQPGEREPTAVVHATRVTCDSTARPATH